VFRTTAAILNVLLASACSGGKAAPTHVEQPAFHGNDNPAVPQRNQYWQGHNDSAPHQQNRMLQKYFSVAAHHPRGNRNLRGGYFYHRRQVLSLNDEKRVWTTCLNVSNSGQQARSMADNGAWPLDGQSLTV